MPELIKHNTLLTYLWKKLRSTSLFNAIDHAVGISGVADAGVGNVIPVGKNLVIAAPLVQIFEKFAIKGNKFCAGNHMKTLLLYLYSL